MKVNKLTSPIRHCSIDELDSASEIILAINPGSTSTKLGLGGLINEKLHLFETSLEIKEKIRDFTVDYKIIKRLILEFLKKNNCSLEKIVLICGRGGILKPNQGGLIQINQQDDNGKYKIIKSIEEDLTINPELHHESNMGALIASAIAEDINKPAFILDPVTTDVNSEFNKYSGKRGFERRSIWHALNIKAALRSFSENLDRELKSINAVLVHIGGGITIASCRDGEIMDTTNALVGDGPMATKRGIIQAADIVNLTVFQYKKGRTLENIIINEFASNAGMKSYVGTESLKEIEEKILQAEEIKNKKKISDLLKEDEVNKILNSKNNNLDNGINLVIDSVQENWPDVNKQELFSLIKAELYLKVLGIMAYQIAGYIGNFALKIKKSLDGVVFTGGGANSSLLLSLINEYLNILNTDIYAIPGSLEQWAMVEQSYMFLQGKLQIKSYKPKRQVTQGNIFNNHFIENINIKMPSPGKIFSTSKMVDILENAKQIGTRKNITLAVIKGSKSSKKAAQIGLDEKIINTIVEVDDVHEAVSLFNKGEVDLIMKGADKTSDFLKPLIKLKLPFYEKITYATITMVNIENKDRLIIFSDAGITTGLDEFALIVMIKNLSYLAYSLGMEPKVALLSASEKASPRINLSESSKSISKLAWPFVVDGPISYDIAMSEKTAVNKNYKGKIRGDANILIHMDINSANVYYKHLLLSPKNTINNYFANAVIGLPAVLASRESPEQEKLLTLALSVVLSEVDNRVK